MPPCRGMKRGGSGGEGAVPKEAPLEAPPHRRCGFASASGLHDEVPAGLSPHGGERGIPPQLLFFGVSLTIWPSSSVTA